MSEQRLDLNHIQWSDEKQYYYSTLYAKYRRTKHTPSSILAEALRAQASEDALRSIIARLLLSLQDVQTACDCETCKAIEEAKCILGLEE